MGCSIKEDRSLCPEAMVVDWGVVKESFEEGTVVWGMEGIGEDTLGVEELPDYSSVAVPSGGPVWLYAFLSSGDSRPSLVSEAGVEYGEVYSYFFHSGVTCRDTVRLRRNFVRMIIKMDDIYNPALSYGLFGHYIGFSHRGDLAEGEFSCPLKIVSGIVSSVTVPRQGDSSLRMNVYSGGELVRSFPIGKYIVESGYDWSAPDLDDIYLEVSVTTASVTFKVGLWSKTVNLEINV